MSNTENENEEGSTSPTEDREFDEMVGELGAAERSRTIRTAVIGVVIFAVAGLAFWWMITHTEDLFRPDVDYQGAELNRPVAPTDPVCRSMIADIYGMAEEYSDYDLEMEDEIWGDNEAEITELRDVVLSFRSRLAELEDNIDQGVYYLEPELGHPPIAEQLEEWFGKMDNEFRILDEMSDKRLRMLAGEEVAEREGLWEDPENLRDVVLMNVHENFEEFRVWVRRGASPCGPAPEGVEPWPEE